MNKRGSRTFKKDALGATFFSVAASRPILLRFALEQDHQTVAERLGTTPTNARSRLARALRLLRSALDRIGGAMVGPGWPWFATANPAAAVVVLALAGSSSIRPTPTDAAVGEPSPRVQVVAVAGTRAPAPRPAPPRPEGPRPVLETSSPKPAPHSAPAPTDPIATEASSKEVARFDFDDDALTGDRPQGDGDLVVIPPVLRHPSLIEIREDFRQELIKSLEDL